MGNYKCPCGDPNCKVWLHIQPVEHDDESINISITGAAADVVTWVSPQDAVAMAVDLARAAFDLKRTSPNNQSRMWRLLEEIHSFMVASDEDQTISWENRILTELEALMDLHKKGEI